MNKTQVGVVLEGFMEEVISPLDLGQEEVK